MSDGYKAQGPWKVPGKVLAVRRWAPWSAHYIDGVFLFVTCNVVWRPITWLTASEHCTWSVEISPSVGRHSKQTDASPPVVCRTLLFPLSRRLNLDRVTVHTVHRSHKLHGVYKRCSVGEVSWVMKTEWEVITTLYVTRLSHWGITVFQHNSQAHWCICQI
jgi:hypothetical protein